MKVLLTGARGMLGNDISSVLQKRGIEFIGVDKDEFNITDETAVKVFISQYKPDIIIHCAAYTAVDKAEEEREIALRVNAEGTRHLASAAAEINARFTYISTDYVFDGEGSEPFEVDAQCSPANWYGHTKLLGEEAVKACLNDYFIIRVSWLFGHNGNNFVKTMLQLAETRNELNVVNDQIGSPTYTADLAELVVDISLSEKYGIYHATNEGFCNWCEFAEKIFEFAGKEITVNAIHSEDYKTAAVRPKNSRLSKNALEKNGFNRLPGWEDALKRYLKGNK